MRINRAVLFYSVIGIFVATAVLTLMGLIGKVSIAEQYLKPLFTTLIIQLVAVVIGLFKMTDWFGTEWEPWVGELVIGEWWQYVRLGEENVLAFLEISHSKKEQMLKFKGRAFTSEGDFHSIFWSSAVSMNAATLELHYFWAGDHTHEDDDFSGVGYIRFTNTKESKVADEGTGWFTRGDLDRVDVVDRKKAEYRRAKAEESQVMRSGNDSQASKDLVASVYSQWT